MSGLTYITSHPLKAEQLGRHLRIPVNHYKLDLPEIQSLDAGAVASAKAQTAHGIVGGPVLVEDFSLRFSALGGNLPGPLIKWFLADLKAAGLCKIAQMNAHPDAVAEVAFAFYDGQSLRTFWGRTNGTIADHPRGPDGFGTDSIFIPAGQSKTWAEMTEAEQDVTSIRRLALNDLAAFLATHPLFQVSVAQAPAFM